MKQVYLDYAATTPVKEEVVKEMLPYYTGVYGNPSSLYTAGLEAKEGLDEARKKGRIADKRRSEGDILHFVRHGS